MKKIIVGFLAAVFIALPSLASAGYSSGGAVLLTRLEISKDNSTWVNYLAEENPGNQTLTVSPGDTVYLRLKTWNTGDAPAVNIQYTSTWTNPTAIDAVSPFDPGVNDDLDNDATFYYKLSGLPDMNTGTINFTLDAATNGTSDQTGYQSGEIVARVKAGTPDQTVVLTTVQITGSQLIGWWQRLLIPRAYADDSATTQVRILVSNPPAAVATTTQTLPVTGPDPAFAADNSTTSVAPTTLPSSNKYLWTRAKEWMNTYLFTYKKSSKAETLDRYADERINEMNYAQSINSASDLQQSLNRYEFQKMKALEYARSADNQGVMNQIRERTLEQQRVMTELQLKLDEEKDLQNKVVEIQKNTAEKIVEVVKVVQGGEASETVASGIKNVWYVMVTVETGGTGNAPADWVYAPGTSGSGSGGVKVEGGASQYAPGSEGAGSGGVKVEGGQQGVQGGGGSGGQTVSPGN